MVLFAEKSQTFPSGKLFTILMSRPVKRPVLQKNTYCINVDDPNEVFTLFELEDVQKAREFFESAALRTGMQQAGTVNKPDFYLLSD
jgi:hypothetical protein